jgi:hypothetical protein
MRVLNRPPMMRNPGQENCATGQKTQFEKAGVVDKTLNDRVKGSKREAVTW